MNPSRIQTIIFTLLIALIATAALSCNLLSLMEYLRIFIVGMALALVYVANAKNLALSYTCKCFLGLAFAFIIYAVDSNSNSVTTLVTSTNYTPSISSFRVISLMILLAGLACWLLPVVSNTIFFSDWRESFSRTEIYAIVTVMAFCLTSIVVETVFGKKEAVLGYILSGTKLIDCCIVYILVTHGFDYDQSKANKHYKFLFYITIAICFFIALIGGSKAIKAYQNVRLPLDAQERQAITTNQEKLLRVFALNSDETRAVYQAGYAAGVKDYKAAKKATSSLDKFPRPALKEIELHNFLNQSNYFKAIQLLEQLPLSLTFDHEFKKYNQDLLERLKSEPNQTSLWYLAALLNFRSDRQDKTLIEAFLKFSPEHANANYLKNTFSSTPTSASTNILGLAAKNWLIPTTEEKSVIAQKDYITIMYNQQVDGMLWLEKGKYIVNVLARDEGSRKVENFNPACKMRVWVDNQFKDFEVFSPEREFQTYSMSVNIKKTPIKVVIEFANDTYDAKNGWDRNLSISKLEFVKD